MRIGTGNADGRRAGRRGLLLLLAALSLAAIVSSGCASMTGLVTGAGTGAVDLPMEVYRHNQRAFDNNPIFWAPNVLILGPVGIVGGPVVGFLKGVALDAEWLLGRENYDAIFDHYDLPSVWRPYTVRW
jgi:hypothetical protein